MGKLAISLVLLLMANIELSAQRINRQYNNISISAALKDLNAAQDKYAINFVYNELEDFKVTKNIHNISVPDAVQQLIGFYPIRMTQVENTLIVECTQKASNKMTGRILDTQHRPVDFANVALLNLSDSTFITGGITNENGLFVIPCEAKKAIVKVSCVGYNTYYNVYGTGEIGAITLNEATMNLQNVVVKGHRKYISRENGKLTLNVQNSNLQNIGKATDVIKYVPGMLYTNGKYEVFGKGEPVIYIDGRKVANASELSLISSSNVKSVQLITNPGAEYDADTRSVIAINTIHHKLDGLSGIASAELSRHKNWSNNEDINLNIHKGALDVFLAYQYDNTRSDIRYDIDQTNFEQDIFHEVSASEYSDRSCSHDYSVGMNYAINKNHTIGGKYMGTISNYKLLDSPYDYMLTYKNNELLTSTDNKTDESEKEKFHNVNAYYIGKLSDKLQFNLDADYVCSRLKHHQQVTETSQTDASSEVTHMQNVQRNRAVAFKGVFAWSINEKHGLDLGTDFSKISSWGTSVNEEGKIANDQFKNKETKYAGFVSYRLSSEKWRGSLGLRYEFVHAINTDQGEVRNKANYSDLLPSFSLSTFLGRVYLNFDFSSRVNRPSFRQLNNSVSYNNQYHYEQGNIYLKPQYVYDTEVSMNYSFFDFKLDYQYIKDYIHPTVVAISGKPGTVAWMSTNAKDFKQLGAQCVVSPVFGCWRPTLSVGVYKPFFSLTYNGEQMDYNHPYGLLACQNSVELKSDWLFRSDFYWNIKGHHGIYEQNSHTTFNMMVQKQLLKKRLTITLKAEDLFDWSKLNDVKKVNFVVQNRKVNNFNRCVIASISYNFNSFKDKYNGSGSADDEINRF